jgi:hypothetical protein
MRRLVPLMLLFAACTGAAEDTTTTPLAEPFTTTTTAQTTTTTEPTTTTAVDGTGPVDICPRGTVWKTGLTYHAPCFLVPVSFTPGVELGLAQRISTVWSENRTRRPKPPSFIVHWCSV